MKIEPFLLERWMTAHELKASYDIAESGILPLSTNDLLAFEEPEERQTILEGLLETPLGYSEASGSLELRTTLANTYRDCEPENILVTTGAIEANFLLFNVLLDSGDHVVAVNPAHLFLGSNHMNMRDAANTAVCSVVDPLHNQRRRNAYSD